MTLHLQRYEEDDSFANLQVSLIPFGTEVDRLFATMEFSEESFDAFLEAERENGRDTVLTVDHNPGIATTLAREGNDTLVLSTKNDYNGVTMFAELDMRDSLSQTVARKVETGLVTKASAGVTISKYTIEEPDGDDEDEALEKGKKKRTKPHFTVLEAELREGSLVVWPAFMDTDVRMSEYSGGESTGSLDMRLFNTNGEKFDLEKIVEDFKEERMRQREAPRSGITAAEALARLRGGG